MPTWNEAGARWLRERRFKASIEHDRAKLAWLEPRLGHLELEAIDHDLVAAIAAEKVVATSMATANRYLALIRAILRRACLLWEWIRRVPPIELYPEPKRRIRWLTRHQVAVLLQELPAHQRYLVLFALATGLRQANVLQLEWSQVDLERRLAWIHADQAKARREIRVPLSAAAIAVLEACQGKHARYVFTFRGKPLRAANTRAWREALKRAGIEDFKWHDLRHTWASWHAQEGTPLFVLQELGGWSSEAMVKRYAHLAPHHFAQHAEVVGQLLLPLTSTSDETLADF